MRRLDANLTFRINCLRGIGQHGHKNLIDFARIAVEFRYSPELFYDLSVVLDNVLDERQSTFDTFVNIHFLIFSFIKTGKVF